MPPFVFVSAYEHGQSELIVVGDVHGCCGEMVTLLERCGYRLGNLEDRERFSVVLAGDLVNKVGSKIGVWYLTPCTPRYPGIPGVVLSIEGLVGCTVEYFLTSDVSHFLDLYIYQEGKHNYNIPGIFCAAGTLPGWHECSVSSVFDCMGSVEPK